MMARRSISAWCVVLGAGLGLSAAVDAEPAPPAKKKPAARAGAKPDKKPPGAPAKTAGSAPTSADPAASGAGSAVQMAEDPPPSDMTGTAEDPQAPRTVSDTEEAAVTAQVAPPRPPGYPVEEVLRPITLPENLSEVSVAPHAQVSPYAGSTALRARYGVTSKVQLGLTYLIGGIFDDPATLESKQAFHPGKAIGIDATVMLQDWLGVQVGLPLYISPLAVSLTLGAPIKFTFADKIAIGGLDDLLNIRLDRFAPTFYQELQNARNAADTMINTIKSNGELRVSLYGMYQYERDIVIIARIGVQAENFTSGKDDACASECLTTYLHAGFRYTPRRYLDLGLSIGFDDLAHGGTFEPAGFLAFRI